MEDQASREFAKEIAMAVFKEDERRQELEQQLMDGNVVKWFMGENAEIAMPDTELQEMAIASTLQSWTDGTIRHVGEDVRVNAKFQREVMVRAIEALKIKSMADKNIIELMNTIMHRENRDYYKLDDLWFHNSDMTMNKIYKLAQNARVVWNIGIGPTSSFLQTITRVFFEGMKRFYEPLSYVFHVNLSSTGNTSVTLTELLRAIANTPTRESSGDNLVEGNVEFLKLLELVDELIYYVYSDVNSENVYLEHVNLMIKMAQDKLKGKKFLMLIENLHDAIEMDSNSIWLQKIPLSRNSSRWLISTASHHVYETSIRASLSIGNHEALSFDSFQNFDYALLIREALIDAVNSIHNAIHKEEEQFWCRIAYYCTCYGILFHPLHEDGQTSRNSITSDELIRHWVAGGLLDVLTTRNSQQTNKESCSKYRSAYDVGKIMLEALQEYSLLPHYSSHTNSSISSASSACTTGMSLLASHVNRIKLEELFDELLGRNMSWISFMDDEARHLSWDERWDASILILRGYSKILDFPFSDIYQTDYFRVLDLSYTSMNSLPCWISSLRNLRLLSLRGCCELKTLYSANNVSPLTTLEYLEVLDMNGVPLLELAQEHVSRKSNLYHLDISGSRITILSPDFFSDMSNLEELIIGCDNEELVNHNDLPHSLFALSNLLVLHVMGTQIRSFPEDAFEGMHRIQLLKLINNKFLMSLPKSLSKTKSLKELHIEGCNDLKEDEVLIGGSVKIVFFSSITQWKHLPKSLSQEGSCLENLHIKGWKALKDIKMHGHPNLRSISLSGQWIRNLSLHGCTKLEVVDLKDDLIALQDVDLSSTAVKELPPNIPNQPNLKRLLLSNVPCIKRFPWHQFVRFPKMFYFSNCENDDDHPTIETIKDGVQVYINDSRFFYSFNANVAQELVMKGEFLQHFYVRVASCTVRSKEPRNEEIELPQVTTPSLYINVHYSNAVDVMSMVKHQPTQRHVEIFAMSRFPNGLKHLLSTTDSISMTDDAHVSCLSDLSNNFMQLSICQLQRCHQMIVVFKINESEILRPKLITLELLKQVYLEYCPRLEKIFPYSSKLPKLEMLVILFCPNLKTIFYKQDGCQEVFPLPSLKIMCFQELPRLLHIYEDDKFTFDAPKWKEFYVRGCRGLQHLPLLKNRSKESKVEVNGESDWWINLQCKSNYYKPYLPPKFASLDKDAKIKSYLV